MDNYEKVIGKSKIFFVSPRIDNDTQTVLVKALLRNKKGIFKADQSVKVRVIYNQAPGILTPTSGVTHFGDLDFVYVINKIGNKFIAKQRPVKLGNIQEQPICSA